MGRADISSIVFFQSDASKFEMAHEVQHWRDFESPAYNRDFAARMKPYLEAKYIEAEVRDYIWRLFWELRGHVAQQLQAYADMKARAPYINRIGDLVTGTPPYFPAETGTPKEMKYHFEFEANEARNAFQFSYGQVFREIADAIEKQSPALYRKFLLEAAKFDLSDNPENRLTVQSILGLD
ncbi:MAG: hypothetical protein ABL958_12390, partial [Bdellovibrionia bacterium]